MISFIWGATIMYLLGAAFFLDTFEASDIETEDDASIKLALIWPYVAVMVILHRIMGSKEGDEE